MSNKVSFQCSRDTQKPISSKATVVVTSRPATTMLTAEFKRGLDQHIELTRLTFRHTSLSISIKKYQQSLSFSFLNVAMARLVSSSGW